MDFTYTADQQQLRKEIVAFARAKLNAGVIERDREQVFSRDLWKECGTMGLPGLPVPEEFGGLGLDPLSTAMALEALYSKRQILEAYLNLVPCGGNIEGVGAASLIYFDKPARALTLAETLTLAVLLDRATITNFRGSLQSLIWPEAAVAWILQ